MTPLVISPDKHIEIARVNQIRLTQPTTAMLRTAQTKAMRIKDAVDPITADCHVEYRAVHKSGIRPLHVISLAVIHATQGGTARSNAIYFTQKNSGGSTQLVVDDYQCFRCLNDNEIPWGAPGANYNGFHIEQCGYSSWASTMWTKRHRKTLMRAAYKTAYHCKKYKIKIRFLTAASLKKGILDGITTHVECSKAFGSDHTDPGSNWPRLLFMSMVRAYYVGLTIRRKNVSEGS